MVLGDWNAVCRSRTFVDSALPGSQFFASFFSALVSLPASGPAAATSTTQKSSTSHLVRRPTMIRVATLDTSEPPVRRTSLFAVPKKEQPHDPRLPAHQSPLSVT